MDRAEADDRGQKPLRGVVHVHLVWMEDEVPHLFFWLERGRAALPRDRRMAIGRRATGTPAHPRLARLPVLYGALEAIMPTLAAYLSEAWQLDLPAERNATIELFLPAVGATLPWADRLGTVAPAPRASLSVRPVAVGGGIYRLDFLAAPLVGLLDQASDFAPSAALAWLRALARLAAELWLEGNVLPAATEELYGTHLHWQPALDEATTRRRLRALVDRFPLALLAADEPETWTRPPSRAWDESVTLLGGLLDGLARFPARPGGRPKRIVPGRGSLGVTGQGHGLRLAAHALRSVPATLLYGLAAQRLEERLAAWTEPSRRALDGAYPQLAFGLLPPAPLANAAANAAGPDAPPASSLLSEETAWHLRPVVRLFDAPDDALPVGAWADRNTPAEGLARALDLSVRELSDWTRDELRRAARDLPPLRARLPEDALPAAISLSSREVVPFLRRWAPKLQERGFGIVLPDGLAQSADRLRLSLRRASAPSAPPGLGHLGLGAVTDLTAVVAVGGRVLDPDEVRSLLAQGEGLALLPSGAVEVDREDLRRIARLVEAWRRAGPDGGLRLGDALGLAAELTASGEGEEASARILEAATGYFGRLMGAVRDGRPALHGLEAPPGAAEGAAARLRPYQSDGLRWLWSLTEHGLGGLLADDMGLGKTIQTIALIEARKRCGLAGTLPTGAEDKDAKAVLGGTGPLPTLLVCPTSVLTNWRLEVERFAPGLVLHIHHGAGRGREAAELARTAQAADLVVTSYALLARDAAALTALPWDGVVLDEAQAVKNAATQASRSARLLRSRYRLALTGTPVENRLEDLWAIFAFLDPGYLGSLESFRRHFAAPVQSRGELEPARVLHHLVAPFVLRRLKTDPSIVRDLPPKVEVKETCGLTPEQATLYRGVVGRLERELPLAEGMRRRALIAVAMLRLKQILNHPGQYLRETEAYRPERSGKAARILEIVDEALSEGDRLILFTQFTSFGEGMRPALSALAGADVPFLRGSTERGARDAMVARFQAGEGSPVLLLSLRAGGVGLNLTSANRVVHMDRWWNPAVETQATDRAYRIGQDQRVIVHTLVTEGTLEERIDSMLREKRELAEIVVGGGEAWLTELDDDTLFHLVALREDAVLGAEG